MIRSFVRISAVELGFTREGLVVMEVLPLDRSPAVHQEDDTSLVQQIRTIPGMQSAGIVDQFSLSGGTTFTSISVDGKRGGISVFEVTPGTSRRSAPRSRPGGCRRRQTIDRASVAR